MTLMTSHGMIHLELLIATPYITKPALNRLIRLPHMQAAIILLVTKMISKKASCAKLLLNQIYLSLCQWKGTKRPD